MQNLFYHHPLDTPGREKVPATSPPGAETARMETASKAEALRFEAFAKASRADDLHNELAQCQATLHELVKNRSGS